VGGAVWPWTIKGPARTRVAIRIKRARGEMFDFMK
jgi:hypothetical protein